MRAPHEPPPIWFDFEVQDEQLTCKMIVIVPCFDAWMNVTRVKRMELSESERPAHIEALKSWFNKHPMVTIDGIVVAPTIQEIVFKPIMDHQGITIDYAEVKLNYSLKDKPKRIKLRWDQWEIFPDWPLRGLDALFAWDDEQIAVGLDETEPEYVWHAPLNPKKKLVLPVPPPAPPRIRVPLLSVACLAGLIFFAFLSFALKLGTRVRWIGVAALFVLAVALQGQMVRSMRPPWMADAQLPTVEEAQDIFAALQQNTYRAFDHEDEEAVYDVLARSVDGELLERVYGEVFESLVLRDDGGAVCQVRSVKILKSTVTLPKDPEKREFKVRAKWRVTGRVGHYGHEHIRVNQYVADYTLREREEGWRISDVDILNQRRMDPKALGIIK